MLALEFVRELNKLEEVGDSERRRGHRERLRGQAERLEHRLPARGAPRDRHPLWLDERVRKRRKLLHGDHGIPHVGDALVAL